jgi:hypothetical protein
VNVWTQVGDAVGWLALVLVWVVFGAVALIVLAAVGVLLWASISAAISQVKGKPARAVGRVTSIFRRKRDE